MLTWEPQDQKKNKNKEKENTQMEYSSLEISEMRKNRCLKKLVIQTRTRPKDRHKVIFNLEQKILSVTNLFPFI